MLTNETQFIEEYETHKFSCFASDVEVFRRGFPARVETNMGNGMPFIATSKKVNADGDIEYVRYYQANGCIELKVFND